MPTEISPAAEHALVAGLLEAAPDAFVAVDGDGLIIHVNARAEELFGYRRDELIGAGIEVLVPETLREVHGRHRAGYMRAPRVRPMAVGLRLAVRRKDGSEFKAEISLGPLQVDGSTLVAAMVRDVTERLEIEAEREDLRWRLERAEVDALRRRSEKMEKLGKLAGGIAHDFNNLLSLIGPYAEFIADAVTPESVAAHADDTGFWDRVGEDIAIVQRATRRAGDLAAQLLTFARRHVTRPQEVDLGAFLSDVAHLLGGSMGDDIQLACTVAPDTQPIYFDPSQLEQVLVNLALNAVAAMPDGGTLTVEAENDCSDADRVSLRVVDTGAGMAPETIERAFEPFFTTKPPGHGPGLGLASAYGIVTAEGGEITIDSELGRGTIVTMLLPAYRAGGPQSMA